MDVLSAYKTRIETRGRNKREVVLNRESRNIKTNLKNNLSHQIVVINDYTQEIAVINSDNMFEKTIISQPGEDLPHGGLVYWMDNYWLITERDANTTIYTRAKMIQCNHLLKWVTDDGIIHEQWCVIEDGTKYLTGELEDRNFVVTRGDSRIAMTIARNEYTVKFNRENRFLIDDPESEHKLAYLLTKPLKLGSTFNNKGVFKFVLQEVTATDDDNHELGIANYYKHFPKIKVDEGTMSTEPGNTNDVIEDVGKKVWL